MKSCTWLWPQLCSSTSSSDQSLWTLPISNRKDQSLWTLPISNRNHRKTCFPYISFCAPKTVCCLIYLLFSVNDCVDCLYLTVQIQWGACGLVLAGNVVVFLTILGYLYVFGNDDFDYSMWWAMFTSVVFSSINCHWKQQQQPEDFEYTVRIHCGCIWKKIYSKFCSMFNSAHINFTGNIIYIHAGEVIKHDGNSGANDKLHQQKLQNRSTETRHRCKVWLKLFLLSTSVVCFSLCRCLCLSEICMCPI